MSAVLQFRPGARNSAFSLPAGATIDAGACSKAPRHVLRALPAPDCPRCHGLPHESDDGDLSPWLCDVCLEQLAEIAAEQAEEDRARDAADDRQFWGAR